MILVIENFVFLVETFLFVEFLEGFCLVVQTESISAHTTISSSSLFVFQRALFQEKQSRCSRFHEWGWRFCFPSICDTKKIDIVVNNDHRVVILDQTYEKVIWLRKIKVIRLHVSTSQSDECCSLLFTTVLPHQCVNQVSVYSHHLLLMNWHSVWQQFPGAADWAPAKQPLESVIADRQLD